MTHPRTARPTRHLLLAAACALALAAGCQPQGEPDLAAVDTGAGPAGTGEPGATGGPGPADPAESASAGDDGAPLPDQPSLRVPTLDHGDYDLAAHRGKWVVVNFWATWCAPCLKEMPELSALDAMNEHIEVIGLAYEDIDVAAMREFLEAHPVVYPIAIVDVYDPPADFQTPRGLPMTYLMDPEGRVAERFLGPVTASDIERVVDAGSATGG